MIRNIENPTKRCPRCGGVNLDKSPSSSSSHKWTDIRCRDCGWAAVARASDIADGRKIIQLACNDPDHLFGE